MVPLAVKLIAVGMAIVISDEALHPFASVAKTVYVPDAVAEYGDVALAVFTL